MKNAPVATIASNSVWAQKSGRELFNSPQAVEVHEEKVEKAPERPHVHHVVMPQQSVEVHAPSHITHIDAEESAPDVEPLVDSLSTFQIEEAAPAVQVSPEPQPHDARDDYRPHVVQSEKIAAAKVVKKTAPRHSNKLDSLNITLDGVSFGFGGSPTAHEVSHHATAEPVAVAESPVVQESVSYASFASAEKSNPLERMTAPFFLCDVIEFRFQHQQAHQQPHQAQPPMGQVDGKLGARPGSQPQAQRRDQGGKGYAGEMKQGQGYPYMFPYYHQQYYPHYYGGPRYMPRPPQPYGMNQPPFMGGASQEQFYSSPEHQEQYKNAQPYMYYEQQQHYGQQQVPKQGARSVPAGSSVSSNGSVNQLGDGNPVYEVWLFTPFLIVQEGHFSYPGNSYGPRAAAFGSSPGFMQPQHWAGGSN